METVTIDEITFKVEELTKQGTISSVYKILDGKYAGKILKVGNLENEIRILNLLEKSINCHQYILYGIEVDKYMNDEFEEEEYSDDFESYTNSTYKGGYKYQMAIIFDKYQMDLEDYIKTKTVSYEDLEKVYNSISNAIECLIKAGVRHCDIKPANILVKLNGNRIKECVLTDFGLGIIDSDYNNDYNEIETILQRRGTAIYFSPQVSAKCNNDRWALGCVLIQMITGYNLPLYQGNKHTALFNVKKQPTIPTFNQLTNIDTFFNFNETHTPRTSVIDDSRIESFYNDKIMPLFTQCLSNVGGSLKLTKTSEKVFVLGRNRIIYLGSHRKKYIKTKGQFMPLTKAENKY